MCAAGMSEVGLSEVGLSSVAGPVATLLPREGMMAVVRNRRALITAVRPFDADEAGRLHLVEVDYSDGIGAESDLLFLDQGSWRCSQTECQIDAARVQACLPNCPI